MTINIALDAMGGDSAPHVIIDGAAQVVKEIDVQFTIFGKGELVSKLIDSHPLLKEKSIFIACQDIIDNDTKPAHAIRRCRDSSMARAVESVREGKCHAVVSAGNTGAYMALSKIMLRTIDAVDRPAIPAIFPNMKHTSTIALDMGANSECSAKNLEQFAVMGSAYANVRLGIERPTVGLLNIGSEDLKGHQNIQEAAELLKNNPDINFYGFVEGNDITKGTVDVVVTDGFTGNITLKALEGAARMITSAFKRALTSNIISKIGAFLAKKSLVNVSKEFDPKLYNGAPFLGLKGIAIKSHGGTDAIGFRNAILAAYALVEANYIARVEEKMKSNES